MKVNSLKKNVDFRFVYRRGKSFSNRLLVLYVLKNNKNYNRLGVSVSKKVGGSVVRSRIKRLIKESYRLNQYNLKQGFDFIFIARGPINGKGFFEVQKALLDLLNKLEDKKPH